MALYNFEDSNENDAISKSKSFTMDITADEQPSQLTQNLILHQSPQQSPKFKTSQSSNTKNYAGFIDLEK